MSNWKLIQTLSEQKKENIARNVIENSWYTFLQKDTRPSECVVANKLGITNWRAIDVESHRISGTINLSNFKSENKNFGLKYLSDIHRHLFKDIFDFAGEKRVCGLSTENLCFTDPRKIQTEWKEKISPILNETNGMKDVGTEEEFLEKTALLYKNLILIHPFREGNGRSIRTYIIEIAKNAGVKLDFSKINNNIQAKRSQKKISECTIPQVISLLKTCIVQARPWMTNGWTRNVELSKGRRGEESIRRVLNKNNSELLIRKMASTLNKIQNGVDVAANEAKYKMYKTEVSKKNEVIEEKRIDAIAKNVAKELRAIENIHREGYILQPRSAQSLLKYYSDCDKMIDSGVEPPFLMNLRVAKENIQIQREWILNNENKLQQKNTNIQNLIQNGLNPEIATSEIMNEETVKNIIPTYETLCERMNKSMEEIKNCTGEELESRQANLYIFSTIVLEQSANIGDKETMFMASKAQLYSQLSQQGLTHEQIEEQLNPVVQPTNTIDNVVAVQNEQAPVIVEQQPLVQTIINENPQPVSNI